MKKTILLLIILSILHLIICVKVLRADTERPRFKVQDPATQADLEDLNKAASLHNHTGVDGSQQIPKAADAIDNAITSDFRGQVIYSNLDGYWCGSTMTGVSTAWVRLDAPATPCGH